MVRAADHPRLALAVDDRAAARNRLVLVRAPISDRGADLVHLLLGLGEGDSVPVVEELLGRLSVGAPRPREVMKVTVLWDKDVGHLSGAAAAGFPRFQARFAGQLGGGRGPPVLVVGEPSLGIHARILVAGPLDADEAASARGDALAPLSVVNVVAADGEISRANVLS